MKDFKKRLLNRGTLVSLGSQIIILAQVVAYLLFGAEIPAGVISQLAIGGNAILVILTVLGILNNPTTENKGFGDDK